MSTGFWVVSTMPTPKARACFTRVSMGRLLGGSATGDAPGGIFLMDQDTFEVLGPWELDRGPQKLSYDFWWHLGYDTLVTSEWGTPNQVEHGLQLDQLVRRFSTKSQAEFYIAQSYLAAAAPLAVTAAALKKEEKKITNEKPVSLHPLTFEEALKRILKVKPEKKNKRK